METKRNETNYLKLYLTILFSFCMALICTAILGVLIKNGTSADALIQEAISHYPLKAEDLWPEPWEMVCYVFLWCSFVIIFVITYVLTEKKNLEDNLLASVSTIVSMVLVCGFFYALFFAEKDRFYTNMSWYMYPIIAIIISFVAYMCICWYERGGDCPKTKMKT